MVARTGAACSIEAFVSRVLAPCPGSATRWTTMPPVSRYSRPRRVSRRPTRTCPRPPVPGPSPTASGRSRRTSASAAAASPASRAAGGGVDPRPSPAGVGQQNRRINNRRSGDGEGDPGGVRGRVCPVDARLVHPLRGRHPAGHRRDGDERHQPVRGSPKLAAVVHASDLLGDAVAVGVAVVVRRDQLGEESNRQQLRPEEQGGDGVRPAAPARAAAGTAPATIAVHDPGHRQQGQGPAPRPSRKAMRPHRPRAGAAAGWL